MTLHGVANGSKQDRGIRFAFAHTVLRATLDGADRKIILSLVRQDDDRNVRGKGVHTLEAHDALAVGQIRIEDHGVDSASGKPLQRPRQLTRSIQHGVSIHAVEMLPEPIQTRRLGLYEE